MTAYVMSGSGSLRDTGNAAIFGVVTGRTGGDTYDLNGWNLLIDQDARYGLSGTTSATFGNVTVNATRGGNLNIDGRRVWMIPFTGGSGTLTLGTQITIGGVTCNTIGIYTSLTVAPATTGTAGWLKVTNASGTPGTISSGTYAGFTLTANGAAIRGFIEVVGDEASTINANRLGQVNILGEWFELGTTSGVSNQTLQVPTNGSLRYIAGVYIETGTGTGAFEFWPTAGPTTTTGTEESRGKCVWCDTAGIVRIGNSGAATNGWTPPAGRRVVIGNVFLENCTTAARTANVLPNATIATRYDFTTTGGGVVTMSKVNAAWYLSFSQAYSVTLTDVGAIDTILAAEVATPMTWTRVGVGKKPTELVSSALNLSLCFAGGTFTDCVWTKQSNATTVPNVLISDIAGFSFVRDVARQGVIRGVTLQPSHGITRAVNCTWTEPTVIQGFMNFITCTDCAVTNERYIDCVSGTTVATHVQYVWQVSSSCLRMMFNGLTFPGPANTHPYTALLNIIAAGCTDIKMRNIGTRAVPRDLGSANACGLIYVLGGGAAAADVKIQRVYCSNTRTGIMTGDNSSTRITEENVFGDYADAVDVGAALNFQRKGMGGTGALTAQVGVYGTHWRDGFTSTTAGRIAILMNEPTSLTAAQVALTGGAGFTSAGGLYMPTIGMTAIFEMPGYILGHTAFTNTALVMAGGTATNYTYAWQIDKNDGNGFTAWSAELTAATLGTALAGVTGIDASRGFKLKLRLTTGTTNTTAITSAHLTTISTTTAQDFLYPLDVNTLTLTGLPENTEVRIRQGSYTLAQQADVVGGSYVFAHALAGSPIKAQFTLAGYAFEDIDWMLTAENVSLPVTYAPDPSYTAT